MYSKQKDVGKELRDRVSSISKKIELYYQKIEGELRELATPKKGDYKIKSIVKIKELLNGVIIPLVHDAAQYHILKRKFEKLKGDLEMDIERKDGSELNSRGFVNELEKILKE